MTSSPDLSFSSVEKLQDEDAVGLLAAERQSTDEYLPTRWQKASARWRQSVQEVPHSLTVRFLYAAVITLSITNIATIMYLLATARASARSCPLAINHPPKGVPSPLLPLVTEPSPQMLNVTFYDYGQNMFRLHDSVEADMMWYDYTQVGEQNSP